MNAKEFFKKFISHGAVLYTVFSVFLLLISLMLSEQTASKFLQAKDFLYIALYSYILSLGSTLFASGYFSVPVSRLIHAICYNLGFLSFLLLREMKFSTAVILTVIFAVIYTAAAFITSLIIKKTRTSNQRSTTKGTGRETPSAKKGSGSKAQRSKNNTYESRFS